MRLAILILVTIAFSEGFKYPSLSWMSVRPARRLMSKSIEMVQEASNIERLDEDKKKMEFLAKIIRAEIEEAKEGKFNGKALFQSLLNTFQFQ